MIERDLVYRISVANAAQAIRTIASVGEAVRKQLQQEVALENAVAAAKTTAARKGGDAKKKVVDEGARHEAMQTKLSVNLEKQRARETERSARAGEKARLDVVKQASREIDKAKKSEVREFEKAEKEKTKVAQREAKARLDIERAVGKAQQASAAQQLRENAKQFRVANRAALQRARDAAFDDKRFYRGIGTGIVAAGSGALGAIGGAARMAGRTVRSVAGSLGLNDATDVGDIFSQRMKVQSMIRAVAIEARQAGKEADFDERAAYAKIGGSAAKYGYSQIELAKAVDVYSEKGSGATAVTNLDRIAGQARAMNTSPEVIAKLRAQMGISSGISGKELDEDEKDALIAKMHFMGKTGVFRAEAVAEESESLFSTWTKGGGDFRTGFERYLSFANEARKSAGSGAMARTAINAVQDQIAKKDSKIEKLGVKTHYIDEQGNEQKRDFQDVVMDVIAATNGDERIFSKVFDPAKSGKAFATMVTKFNTTKGNTATKRKAVEELLAGDPSLRDATVAEMTKDSTAAMGAPDAKIAAAKEKIRQSIEATLLPVFESLAEKLPGILKQLEEPISAIGPMLMELGKSLAELWKTVGPILTPLAKDGLNFAVKHPVAALAMGGALSSGGKYVAGAAMRRLGDSLVNTTPGIGGRIGGSVMSGLGGLIGSGNAQHVWVDNMPGGGFGGGGGPGGGGGGLPGIPGVPNVPGAAGPESVYSKGAKAIGGAVLDVLAPVLLTAAAANTGWKLAGGKGEKWDTIDYAGAALAAITAPLSAPIVATGAAVRGLADSNKEEDSATDAFGKNGGPIAAARRIAAAAEAAEADPSEDDWNREVFGKTTYAFGGKKEKTPQEKWESGDYGAFQGVMDSANSMMGGKALSDQPEFSKFLDAMAQAATKLDELSTNAGAAGKNVSKIKS